MGLILTDLLKTLDYSFRGIPFCQIPSANNLTDFLTLDVSYLASPFVVGNKGIIFRNVQKDHSIYVIFAPDGATVDPTSGLMVTFRDTQKDHTIYAEFEEKQIVVLGPELVQFDGYMYMTVELRLIWPNVPVQDSDIILVVHADEAQGAQVFKDDSIYNHSVTGVGCKTGNLNNNIWGNAIDFPYYNKALSPATPTNELTVTDMRKHGILRGFVGTQDENTGSWDITEWCDFTIHFRIKFGEYGFTPLWTGIPPSDPLDLLSISFIDWNGNNNSFAVMFHKANIAICGFALRLGEIFDRNEANTAWIPKDKWTHIAIVMWHYGLRVYQDGIELIQINGGVYSDADYPFGPGAYYPLYTWYNKGNAINIDTFRFGNRPMYISSTFSYYLSFIGQIDELIIAKKALWRGDFTPPSVPYKYEQVVGTFIQVDGVEFNIMADLEVNFRGPGEYDIQFDWDMSFEFIQFQLDVPIEFNLNLGLNFNKDVIRGTALFVWGNSWKKRMFEDYKQSSNDFRIALMRPTYEFDEDNDEYYQNGVDQYEIANGIGYAPGLKLEYLSFSSEGVLSFKDFLSPVGSFGPFQSIVIYEKSLDSRGLVVGCLRLVRLANLIQSQVQISSLTFQIT